MANLVKLFTKLALTEAEFVPKSLGSVRYKTKFVDMPEIGHGRAFRRVVHFPEKYTVAPIKYTNLGGRDPVTGRLAVKGIGGGIKFKYHWVQWVRLGPKEGPPKEEKVIKIIESGTRTAHVALVAGGSEMKYYLATANMKPGDIIKTSSHIPRIPVRANEGDAYPLGALPLGTEVHNIEKVPGGGGRFVHAAGTYATILRKAPDRHVVVTLPSKWEFSLPEECMCTVGRISNAAHSSTPVGSAQRNRELGNRPRSGWWQRKKGIHGRKLRYPPAVITLARNRQRENVEEITLTLDKEFVKTVRSEFHY